MKLKQYFTLIMGLFIGLQLFSQSSQISGTVYDASTNAAVSNAEINVSGTTTTTDANGAFTINCKAPMQITFSAAGFKNYSEQVNKCGGKLNIGLIPAQNDLGEVEISASATPEKSELYHPVSITKLDKKEINRNTGLFLDDAINTNIPGVYMQRRAVSSGQQINIRGYGNGVGFRGANNNFDGQGSKVYLNGIAITDAEGITVLDDIDFGSIAGVEVRKGPSGSLYGLAIAGAVNLTSQKAKPGEVSVGQDFMVGSYGLQRYTTRFQMGTERTSLLVNYGRQLSDGFFVHNKSHKDFVNIIADFDLNQKQSVNTYFGYSNSYDERAGELTIDQFNNRDYSGNARYIKNNAHSEVKSFRGGIGHNYTFNNHFSNKTTVFISGISSNASSAGGWSDKAPVNGGLRSTLNFSYRFSDKLAISSITGVEFQGQYALQSSYRMVVDSANPDGYNIIGDLRSSQATQSYTNSVFSEWTLSLAKDLSVTAGVGISSQILKLEDRIYDANSTRPRNINASYKGLVSPHVALNKVFNKNVSAYASYSKGYKAPVGGNIVIGATGELNTGLKPEEGDQYEIGSKGQLMQGKLQYQVALFQTNFTNKFTSVAVPLDSVTTGYTFIGNSGGQVNKGLEVAVKYNAYASKSAFISSVRPFTNLTYSDFKYKNFNYQGLDAGNPVINDYSGNAVAGVSPIVANFGVDVESNKGLYANLTYQFRDALEITSDGANPTKSYSLLNSKFGFQKRLGEHFDFNLFVGIKNITSTQYYYMVFVNQLNDAYIPAPDKINYYTGLNLKYIF